MSKQKLSDHHSSISLDLVHIEVEGLQIRAFLQSFCEILCAFTFDVVSLQVEVEESWRLRNEITKSFGTYISNRVVSQVNFFDVNGVPLERCTYHDQVIIGYAIREHLLVVAWDIDVD